MTKLPQLPLYLNHIAARFPLSQPASFNPWAALDIWSWILALFSFLAMCMVLLLSQYVLKSAVGDKLTYTLYYFTDVWGSDDWFAQTRTGAYSLFVWTAAFFILNMMYQIDFREGLISQTFEGQVNTWTDIDSFNINLYYFNISQTTPFFSWATAQRNVLEYDQYEFLEVVDIRY